MVLDMIKDHRMYIHLTDLSAADCLAPILKYQRQSSANSSSRLSVETSHHYLSLMSEEIGKGKTEFKCSPPIRNNNNRNRLWEAMKQYEIFNVSSSHLPSTIAAKCLIGGRNRGNFFEAANGISSLQFALPIFWTNCQRNNMTVYDLNRFLSYHPAKLCGLDQNKGRIQVGYDADFTIWDPEEEWTITKEEILFKNKICPYIGKVLKGRVYATVLRGFHVYDANDPVFDSPIGNCLMRKPTKRSERTIRFAAGDC